MNPLSLEPDRRAPGDHGTWNYDDSRLVLEHRTMGYEVDLEKLTTSACMLDTIFQVYCKAWCDEQTMFDLIEALWGLIDPQAYLCSCGRNRGPIDVRAVILANRQLFGEWNV